MSAVVLNDRTSNYSGDPVGKPNLGNMDADMVKLYGNDVALKGALDILTRSDGQLKDFSIREWMLHPEIFENFGSGGNTVNIYQGGSSSGGSSGGGAGYNVTDAEFGAVGDGLTHPLTAEEAAVYNSLFSAYGAQGANAFVVGDELNYAAIQCALWKAAATGAQVYLPAGRYIVNKPLLLKWTATPITGQPNEPLISRISGDGNASIIEGRNIASGRAILELLGERNTDYAVKCELSFLAIEAHSSCNRGSYCLREGDSWSGFTAYRCRFYGANGVRVKVATPATYAQLCSVFRDCTIRTNYLSRWETNEANADFYAVSSENGGAVFDNVKFDNCLINGTVNLRAWVQSFDHCLFYTPSQRPAGFNSNVFVNLGGAAFKSCYFEDHLYAIVALSSIAPITSITVDDSHFSGTQNFGGPTADEAISCNRSVYNFGSLTVRNCRFRNSGYVTACIQAAGIAYEFVGNTDMDAPGVTQITTLVPFAYGRQRQPNNLAAYETEIYNGVRPQIPYFKGTTNFYDDLASHHFQTIENVSVNPAAFTSEILKSGAGVTAMQLRFSVYHSAYTTAILRNRAYIITETASTIVISPNNQEFIYIKGDGVSGRASIGTNADDGANQWQFNVAVRLQGFCTYDSLTSTNYSFDANATIRTTVSAAATVTLCATDARGAAISIHYEIHCRSDSTGYATVALAGSNFFKGMSSLTLAPGETVFLRSNGGSGALGYWTVARCLDRRATRQQFAQTTILDYNSSAAETGVINTGVGNVDVPANSLTPGKTIRVRAFGVLTTTAAPTSRVRLKFGSTVLLDSGAVAVGTVSDVMWELEAEITCLTTGVSGTLVVSGTWIYNGTRVNLFNAASITYDTTATTTLALTNQFSVSAANNRWRTHIFRMIEAG